MSNASSSLAFYRSSKVQAIRTKSSSLRKNSPEKPAGFGGPVRVVLTTLAIFIASQLAAAFIAELLWSLVHSGGNPGDILDNSAPAQFLYILLAEAGAIWLVLLVLKRRGLHLAQIGLGRKPRGRDVLYALGGFIVFFAVLAIINGVLSSVFPSLNGEQQNVGFNNLNGTVNHAFALVALAFLPPLGEETLVRGYLYSGLRSRWRFLPAMLLTSLMFGLAHLELGSGAAVVWAAGIDTFMLSIVLVYLREHTGALYAGMLVHSLNNLIAFGVHFH